ncbi:hypothetical protein [Nocardia carnea]|uniref:hypothetical protein n=1 Tax=Nocardia carnea TaxID=37328 RepID=UPI002453AFE2|nr:hypothetical protein [Nocardia carnea]
MPEFEEPSALIRRVGHASGEGVVTQALSAAPREEPAAEHVQYLGGDLDERFDTPA